MTDKQLQNLGMHVDEVPEWEMDVVCGMEVAPRTTHFHTTFDGKKHYFCNKSCLDHFKANPENYVS
jgi:YHS domain-containing protein